MKIISLTFIALYKIRKKAINQSFNFKIYSKILTSYIQNASQSGQHEIFLIKYNKVIAKVIQD